MNGAVFFILFSKISKKLDPSFMKNNVFSLKIFIFWKIFIRADKIEIKSVQNCTLEKFFSFENFDFWDFLFLFRRLRVTLGAMRHSWEVILCGLKITNHSIWDMIDKISRTQKRVDGRLTSYSWAPLITQYTVFSLFYVQVNQVSKKQLLSRKNAQAGDCAHPVGNRTRACKRPWHPIRSNKIVHQTHFWL